MNRTANVKFLFSERLQVRCEIDHQGDLVVRIHDAAPEAAQMRYSIAAPFSPDHASLSNGGSPAGMASMDRTNQDPILQERSATQSDLVPWLVSRIEGIAESRGVSCDVAAVLVGLPMGEDALVAVADQCAGPPTWAAPWLNR